MALKKAYRTLTGIDLAESYWKISNVVGCKTGLTAHIEVFASQDACDAKLPCVERHEIQFTPDGPNRWDVQAYNFVKKFPEFETAIDC